MLFNNTNMRTAMAYTNAVGDKVYPIIVDIKKGIKSTEEVSFVSSDINTGVLSVAFIQGNDTYNVEGAEVICSIMRPDTTTLEIPCNAVNGNTIEVPLGVNGTSQDGVYSFDFKVFKGGNKIVGTPIMNYSVSLSISNDLVIEEDDRLPVLTMLITQVNELKEETRETINQANVATEATKVATANAIEVTNKANEAVNKVTQDTANAIANVNATSDTMVENVNNAISSMDTTVNSKISEMTDAVNNKITEVDTAKNDMITDVSITKANMVTEVTNAKNEMTATVTNKVNEVEGRFSALTASQQQDAEVIDARDGETSLKARLDRDVEKAKQVYVNVEGSNISIDSSSGYLKNVEILGNTVQDASNLADIRSVGEKVEGQELYEIPVLSVGENVFNNKWELGDISRTTGENVNSSNTKRTDFIKIGGSNIITPCMPKYVKSDGARYVVMIFYDKNKKYLGFHLMGDNYIRNSFTPPVGSEYVRFTMGTTITECEFEVFLDNRSFVSQGNLIESTPYVEDKLTILSPVQLEKVGDVRDRIIEKDGVLGVEKNVGKLPLTSNLEWNSYNSATQSFKTPFTKHQSSYSDSSKLMCNALVSRMGAWEITTEYVSSDNQGILVKLGSDKNPTQDLTGLKLYLDTNNVFVLYQRITPQFIPLPHDQQVKLRTFANKTNISFLTEIEGTIKAQVPKSLGATVNTHTEQISNLNKELDRVKKLEESTVSTVTTESDFTTVEATSNGYFEDVKLEGKTLVNLAPKYSIKWTHSGTWLSTFLIGRNNASNQYSKVLQDLKPNTEYTVIVNIKTNTQSGNIDLNNYQSNTCVFKDNMHIKPSDIGVKTFKVKTVESFDHINPSDMVILRSQSWGIASGETLIEDIMILEGDHTQNPPNGYIEGLKSVGDDTDEIVVSSVNENLFDKNQTLINGYVSMRDDYGLGVIVPSDGCRATDFIRVDSNTTYTLNNDNNTDETCGFYDATKKCITVVRGNIVTSPSNAKYMRCTIKRSDFEQGFQIVRGTQTTKYTPHQADKKRLLFYNNETQTWEKPILREWDSIEKHANGKYYYHQRSGEVVFNGSENWNLNTQTQSESVIRFNLDATSIGMAGNRNPVISDKFRLTTNYDITSNEESIFTSMGGATLFITISKPKLSTQDAQGFKQWLQANNVTVVYRLAQEKVYECTNIDLITYSGETNYIVECGAIVPRTTLKVHNNISNVVSLLQKKVSLLESNVKASQEVQDMMLLETDMRMLDIELALMEFAPMKLNLGGSDMLRSATYFNFLKNHIINETYEKEYLENVMNKYLATGRINQDEYDELYKMLYPPVYDIELPIEP